jgi:hypothetical protein
MIDGYPERNVEFDALRSTSAHQHRQNECCCHRATLDELLADDVMEPVLRAAGYEPDQLREMMTEMARNLVTP